MMRQVSSPVRRGAGRKGQQWTSLAAYPASTFWEHFFLGNFPQLFCLQRRPLGHPNFGTWGLGNSIILVFETPLHSRFCAFMQSYPSQFAHFEIAFQELEV